MPCHRPISILLFFLKRGGGGGGGGGTWAAFNFSGKTDWSIDLLIKTLMGLVITGCANLMI